MDVNPGKKSFLYMLLVVVAIVAVVWVLPKPSTTPPAPRVQENGLTVAQEKAATDTALDLAYKSLKNPDTMSLIGMEAKGNQETKQGFVLMMYTGKNDFGAEKRNRLQLNFTIVGETIRTEALIINDKLVYNRAQK